MGDSLLAADANRLMFDRLAPRYDLFNSLASLGLDRGWRREAVRALAPRDGGRYLDIGCGTGDLSLEILRQAPGAYVVGVDPAPQMLRLGVAKVGRAGMGGHVSLAIGDACDLPFSDGSFDGLASAFALRSFVDRERAFREMRRVLAPAGRAVLLELSVPTNPLLRVGYRFHTRLLGRLIGWLVLGRLAPYRFLLESINRFPPPHLLLQSLEASGLTHLSWRSLSGGVARLCVAHSSGLA